MKKRTAYFMMNLYLLIGLFCGALLASNRLVLLLVMFIVASIGTVVVARVR